jgi:hypothetical protein
MGELSDRVKRLAKNIQDEKSPHSRILAAVDCQWRNHRDIHFRQPCEHTSETTRRYLLDLYQLNLVERVPTECGAARWRKKLG